jgi:hypothetical protein
MKKPHLSPLSLLTFPFVLLTGFAQPVFAQNVFSFPEPSGFPIRNLGLLISRALETLFIIGGILVFIMLVWGGVAWIASGGDKAATQAARDRITSAVVGLAIIASAVAVTLLLQYFFGFQIFGDFPIPRGY